MKHKQNKKMAGIYSLPRKWISALLSAQNKSRGHFSVGLTDEAGAGQVGGKSSFQEGRDSVSNLLR